MKILMSALACEPGKGSELEVGFRALLAAGSKHEVWVLTNSATVPIVRAAIAQYPWAERVHLEGIYFDVDDELYPNLTTPGFHVYYDRWQRKAAARAAKLAKQIDFDVVHHVTLAAHWTRTGVAVVEKPLVWGPIGGGVEVPLHLVSELGWRGMLEELGRVVGRRVLAKFGPARAAHKRAVVIFVQNENTARVLASDAEVHVLPNATSVDVGNVSATGPRRKDILLVGRLLPWKGGRLAVRALRHVQHPDALLRIFGDGPDRRRIERAARRWGIADRVRFEGHVRRNELLQLIATAGVCLHPSFHDEAGLAVAEALSFGTPVVCLDKGGPPEILTHWSNAPAAAVRIDSPERTARSLAAEIDRFLATSPPVANPPYRSATSFEQALLGAYETACNARRRRVDVSMVWAFPAGKPQVFADTLRALSKGVLVYGFGRRLPRSLQRALALQVRVPLMRRLLTEPRPAPQPVCGWTVWRAILQEVQRRSSQPNLEWLHFSSRWGKQRSGVLGLAADGSPRMFVVVGPEKGGAPTPRRSAPSFRVPSCRDSFCYEGWSVREYEPLPRFHRPAQWNVGRMRQVAEDASSTLEGVLPPVPGIPAHWRPIHGDYVPWNLRESEGGQLWLLDWEDACWGPPLADLVRYIVAHYSLGWGNPAQIAALIRKTLTTDLPDDVVEAAMFWCGHRNLQPAKNFRLMTRRDAKDSARAARELAAFRLLSSSARRRPDRSILHDFLRS